MFASTSRVYPGSPGKGARDPSIRPTTVGGRDTPTIAGGRRPNFKGKTDDYVQRYGTLKFPFSTRTPAKWAKVCIDNTAVDSDKRADAEEQELTEEAEAVLNSLALGRKSLFYKTWGLQKPSVVISMSGSASPNFSLPPTLEQDMTVGLREAVRPARVELANS